MTPWLQAFCMFAFWAGCTIALFGSNDAEMQPLLPTINTLFTAGSGAILVDASASWLFRAHAAKQRYDRPRGDELLDLAVALVNSFRHRISRACVSCI